MLLSQSLTIRQISSTNKLNIQIMKKFLIIPLMLLTMSSSACGNSNEEAGAPESGDTTPSESTNPDNNNNQTTLSMKITIVNNTYTATMEDNAAANDLLSRLPLDITLEDYNNTTEKIFYPSPALNTNGVKGGCAPVPGDITIYAPWKNVAIFCKSWSHSNDLIKIGHIDGDGINALQVSGDVKVRFEKQ